MAAASWVSGRALRGLSSEWDGSDWRLAAFGGGPPGLTRPGLTAAPDGRGVLLYGGVTVAAGTANTQLWRWDGSSWSQVATATAVPPTEDIVYDPAHGHVLLVHQDGVFLLDTPDHASFSPFGLGCPGTAGRPTLAIAGLTWPFLGSTVTLEVRGGGPPAGAALLLLGVSDTVWNGLPLPADLSAFGLTGCTLRSSGEVVLGLPATNGLATWSVGLPPGRAWVGTVLYTQAFLLDPGANRAGFTLTNAAQARLGAR